MTLAFRPGRLPAQPDRPHLKLSTVLAANLPAPPTSDDWLSPVPESVWGMLGNDQWGDCTAAGVGHKRIGDVYANQGRTLTVTTDDTLALYSAVTGFDPNAGPSGSNPTDQGAVCQDVLDYWRKHGFLGERVAAFAKVNLADETEVRQAIHLFGQIYVGINFPDSAMQQFNNGQPWDVVRGATIEGGHCITVGGYDAHGLGGVTWGKVQHLTWAFFRAYAEEAWVLIGPDDVDPATGKGSRGLDLAAFGAAFAALTGEPNPVPQPTPAPEPSPAPTPIPPPSGGFALALRAFLKAAKAFISRAEAWLAGKDN